MKFAVSCATLAVACVLSCVLPVRADMLFSNGPTISGASSTNLTSGQAISNPEVYATTGGLNYTTAGINVKTYVAADDFYLPVDSLLSTCTLYCYQSQSISVAGTKNPVPITASINLWNTTPVTGGSPMLAANLTLTPVSSTFVAWRQSTVPGSTDGTRPIFAYTFSLDGLPNGGLLSAGTYWLQWQLGNGTSTSLLAPLVTPKTQAFNTNFRLYGVPVMNFPAQWFESWEGGDPNSPRPYAVPFELGGTFIPEPALPGPAAFGCLLIARRRR